jgi:phage tail tube protein FII
VHLLERKNFIDNIDCLSLEKNCDCQITRRNTEEDTAGGLVNKAPINMANDDSESSVNVNSLLKTVRRCEGESSIGLQKAEHAGKISGPKDISQEDVITRKSTRTKNNPSVLNQDFFW